jgi:hypothetical protein
MKKPLALLLRKHENDRVGQRSTSRAAPAYAPAFRRGSCRAVALLASCWTALGETSIPSWPLPGASEPLSSAGGIDRRRRRILDRAGRADSGERRPQSGDRARDPLVRAWSRRDCCCASGGAAAGVMGRFRLRSAR